MSKLSKEYNHNVQFNVDYKNIATNKILQSKPISQLNITIKSRGFNLLKYSFNKPSIKIDLQNLIKFKNNTHYYLTNRHIAKIQQQLKSEVSVLNMQPDTLFFDFGILKEKKVKIIPSLKLNFKKGFNISNKILVEPEFITISGAEKIIDSILTIKTANIELNDLYNNFSEVLSLETIKDVKYSINKVKVSAIVEKFTEGNLVLDYRIINLAEDTYLDTFVKKINITYKVSLNNFDKIFAKDFEIICDFNETTKDSLNYLIPKFIKKSFLVTDLKMDQTKIEYLIKK